MRTALVLVLGSVLTATAAPPAGVFGTEKKPDWFAKAVTKVEAKFVPAEAKPGETVTLRLTVELAESYFTYPLHQPDKAAEEMINTLSFPAAAGLIPVGKPGVVSETKSKSEPLLGISDMIYLPGLAMYEQKYVVSPKASSGPVEVAPQLRLSVCTEQNCYPPRTINPAAMLKILDAPAVPVDPVFQADVEKAIGGT